MLAARAPVLLLRVQDRAGPPRCAPCPTCGGEDREIFADVDTWRFSDVQTGLKAREGGGVGEVRPYLEQSTKIRWNGDRQHYERVEIVVDRKNDYYRQSWFDCETRERTFHKEGRNSDPAMHGPSARRGKPRPAAEEDGGQQKT
jgi:hypothetical protein